MADNCTHDCDSCGADCPSKSNPQSFQLEANQYSNVKKVIGVVSGKGGVGKSGRSGYLERCHDRRRR